MTDTSTAGHGDHALPASVIEILSRSEVPIVFADAGLDDAPLIYANDAFCRLSGYDRDEVVGRNCRFLQPPQGAGPVRERIRAFMANDAKTQDRFLISNVRKSGERFLNLLYMSKLRRPGKPTLFLGSQFDITKFTARGADAFDDALASDIQQINALTSQSGWPMLSSTATLASSFETIIQAKLND
ncbi:PAS domain S-box-containing protein [Palleronia salina]|uniref:PAS domain S-box-containing protein n=1 Tax=Palleronia salina TaxID=313368 RepID=A0A1M6K2G9_9RHOB|nr:PAS domain-containing protein [Palleronia salina]SHJ53120.1 PAS domain S-box-containing protein [Palleronia salina]